MNALFIFSLLSLSPFCYHQQNGFAFTQNPYSESYFIKPNQTILNANVKLKKIPGFEFTIVTGQFAFIAIKDHGPVSVNPYSISVPFIRK